MSANEKTMPSQLFPNDPIGLYLHVPFCESKCGYCSFYSVQPAPGQIDFYLASIKAEMRLRSRDPILRGRSFASLYIGGGTPSLLQPRVVEALSRTAIDSFALDSGIEVTVEANPESVCAEFASAVATLPGSRVSLGAQSFCPDVLQFLGRIHSPGTTRGATVMLKDAGVRTISLDLIYGTPGETVECWTRSLDEALALDPDHISAYCLSIDEGTPLSQVVCGGRMRRPDEVLQREMYMSGREKLEAAGLEGYEISNFAKPGSRSRHNQIYWRRGEYIGLGPAAHSFFDGERWCNHRDVKQYCKVLSDGDDPVAWREGITTEQALLETVMLALRTSDGIDLDVLEDKWGPRSRRDIVQRALPMEREGLVSIGEARLTIKPSGYFVSDGIIARLFPQEGGCKE
jgi:oxygen-independent coproporphyrinogen-3 oxidase